MTNEQREAIELLEGIRDNTWTTKYIISSDSKKADTVLSLIKEQQEELDKKDKQIDLMARAFKQDDVRTVEEIKQYFENKVNSGKEN